MNAKQPSHNKLPILYETTSVLLKRILGSLRGNAVQIDYIVKQLDERSFGGLFIILGAVALLPGISIFAGLAMIILGFQMFLGYSTPKLLSIIAQKEINVIHLKTLGGKTVKAIEWVEQFVKPRWLFLSTKPAYAFIGALVMCLSFAVILPLPFSNFPAAIALLFLSVGLLERDGVMIAIGIFTGFVALVISSSIAYATWEGFLFYLYK